MGNVDAELAYLGDFAARPIHYAMPPPPGEAWEQAVYEQRLVHIHDARLLDRPARLDVEGFALFPDPVGDFDFSDRDAIAHAYYPSIVALIKTAIGADRVYVFDHLVRRRERDRRALLPMRVAVLATDETWMERFCTQVMRENFVRDRDIDSPEVVGRILRDLDLDPETVLAAASGAGNKARLRQQTEDALALGIFGAPMFRVGSELFWGNDRLDEALAAARGERR